jgi:hypothetical protein
LPLLFLKSAPIQYSSGGGSWTRKELQPDTLQKQMQKPKGKVIQFLNEFMSESMYANHHQSYQLIRDTLKYFSECQQTGAILSV